MGGDGRRWWRRQRRERGELGVWFERREFIGVGEQRVVVRVIFFGIQRVIVRVERIVFGRIIEQQREFVGKFGIIARVERGEQRREFRRERGLERRRHVG